jgi:hypothetical protein
VHVGFTKQVMGRVAVADAAPDGTQAQILRAAAHVQPVNISRAGANARAEIVQ